MTNPRDTDGSYRVGQSNSHPTTTTGGDVTGRMAGTTPAQSGHVSSTTAPTHTVSHTETIRPSANSHGVSHAKTSAAAAFALVFGVAALFCALTAILAPAAVVLGIIGLILGIAGMKMAKRQNVTGRGVAIGGLVTALLGLLLGGAVLGGLAAVVNNENAVNRISNQLDELKAQLPSGNEVGNTVNDVTN